MKRLVSVSSTLIFLLPFFELFSPVHSQELKSVRAPYTVNANISGIQNDSDIKTLNQETFVIVWHDTPNDQIYFRRFDPFGNSIESVPEESLWVKDAVITGELHPVVDALVSGDFVVGFIGSTFSDPYWIDHVYGQFIENTSQFNREGDNFRMDIGEYGGDRDEISLALHSDPDEYVFGFGLLPWYAIHLFPPDDDNVLLSAFSLPVPLGPPTFPDDFDDLGWVDSEDASGTLCGPADIAVDSNGKFVVVYWTQGAQGCPECIRYRTFQSGTWTRSDSIIIDSGQPQDFSWASVITDKNDNRIFAYNKKDGQGDFHSYFARYTANETRIDASKVDLSVPPEDLGGFPLLAAFKNNDFIVGWVSQSNNNQAIYARRFDSSGSPVDATSDILLVGPGHVENPAIDTFRDRIYLTWTDVSDEGDVRAGVWSVDTEAPAIDPTVQFQPYAVRYDTLDGPIRFHRKVIDEGARIDAGLDLLDFHYARVCPAGDSTALFTPMSQKAGTDSFYADIGVQYAGTKIYYYFEAVDSALNQSRLPIDAPIEMRGPLKIANPGDININGIVDLNDLLLIEDFMCFPRNEFRSDDSVFADINLDGLINCDDVDSIRAVAVDLEFVELPACAAPAPDPWFTFLEVGVGSGDQAGIDIVPVYLINDSTEVGDITFTVNYDSAYFSVSNPVLTQRTSDDYVLHSGGVNGCCPIPPDQSSAPGIEKFSLSTDNGYVDVGSGAIMKFDLQVGDSTPDGKYHFYLTASAMNDTLKEPVNMAPLRGKFFVPTPPPISIVCSPIVDTLLSPSDTLTFNTTLTNHSDSTMSPKFFIYGTTTGPDSFTFLAVDTTEIMMLPPGGKKRDLTDLEVPGIAPLGHYIFTAYVVSPVNEETFDDDSFGFQLAGGSGRPGYGGNQLSSSEGMSPWRVIRGWFGYNDREGNLSEMDMTSSLIPKAFAVSQNYPNPFNPSTTIQFDVPEGQSFERVGLSIYDLRGRLVKILVDAPKGPGRYQVHWDGRDDRGQKVSSGVYIYRIVTGDFTSIRKMLLVR